MSEADLILSGVCGALFVVLSVVGLLLWRYTSFYLPRGAVAMDTLTPGTPVVLEIPAGGSVDLMLRYTTERRRGQSVALTALLQIERASAFVNGNVVNARYALGLSPQAPEPPSLPSQRIASVSYAVKQAGRESTRTVVLATIPGGGAGRVLVDLLVSANTNVTYVACFVKPAKKGFFR